MDINGFERVIQRYLNGQATDEDLVLIEQWFQQTEANDYQLTDEKRAAIAGRLLPRLKAITGPGEERPSAFKSVRRALPVRFTRIAAAFVIMATAGTFGWVFRQQLSDKIMPVAKKTIKAGPYEIKKVQLPDHTMVTLNTGASITFPETYRGDRRTATLQGEAFFEVARDEDKPFIVRTATLHVTVLGTSFVVTEQQSVASVSLVTGMVSVATDQQALAGIRPGLQVLYNKRSRTSSLHAFDAQQVMGWTLHSFSFDAVPLEQALKAIAQKWNVRLILPAGPSGKQFSGDFASNDSLDDMMTALALTTGIYWERTPAGAISIKYP